MRRIASGMILVALLSACSEQPSQSQYNYNEVGQAINIEYALVVASKPVGITGHAATGAPDKSLSGSYIESGIGGLWATAGAAAQQAEADRRGYEYTVVTEARATKTVVQYQNPNDIVFRPSDIVMLQESGTFHRLLTSGNLPEKIIAPHRKKLEELYETVPEVAEQPKPPTVPAPVPVAVSEPPAPKTPEPSSVTLPLPEPRK